MNLEQKTDEREAIRRDPVRIDDRRLNDGECPQAPSRPPS